MPVSAVADVTRAALGRTKIPARQVRRASLLSRDDFAKQAPWEILPGDEVRRGEMPLAPGDVAAVGTLLKRVLDVSPKAMKFLERVFSGKTGEMLREIVPSAKLEGGTLIYAKKDIPKLVEVMRKLDAPEGLRRERQFSTMHQKVKTMWDMDTEVLLAGRHATGIDAMSPLRIRVGRANVISFKPFKPMAQRVRTSQLPDKLYHDSNEAYIRFMEKNNPAYLEQLVREQGEIARTQPFRPGSIETRR